MFHSLCVVHTILECSGFESPGHGSKHGHLQVQFAFSCRSVYCNIYAAMFKQAGCCAFLLLLVMALSSDFLGAVNAAETNSGDKKWVVLTSISYPLEAVKKLAGLDDWRVVVVADKKTPTDWHLENVTFLSVEDQQKLGYKIMDHLPWNNYGRKNVGYLYAISHGAEVIYETDDDNILTVRTVLQLVSSTDNSPELTPNVTGQSAPGYYTMLDVDCPVDFNPYPLFGQGQMWPRGLPIASIKQPSPTCFKRVPARPLIQQGLANNDPDVDAMYRLALPLGVEFDSQAFSVLLPPYTMTPFNSQNTLFLYDALWALLLPVTTTMRVCDIWRGYWAQRLLWDIGGNLAFIPPTVIQNRNPHTVFRDFQEELDLYNKAGSLLADLRNWQPKSPDLPGRMVEVARLLADKGYWASGDVDLMEAWVADLTAAGYKFPDIINPTSFQEQLGAAAAAVVSSEGPSSSALNGTWDQNSFIFPQRWCRHRDVVLVVNFNSLRLTQEAGDSTHLMGMLYAAYKPWFRQVYFTGNTPYGITEPLHPNFVDCANVNRFTPEFVHGHFAHVCLAEVMSKVHDDVDAFGPVNTGFLYINDDVMISPCMITGFNRSNIWYGMQSVTSFSAAHEWFDDRLVSGDTVDKFGKPGQDLTNNANANVSSLLNNRGWHWERNYANGRQRGTLKHHMQAALLDAYGWMSKKIASRLEDSELGGNRFFGIGQGDFFYVPSRFVHPYMTWAHHMRKHHVFTEVAVPNILGLLGDNPSDYEIVGVSMLWGGLNRDAALACIDRVFPVGRSIDGTAVASLLTLPCGSAENMRRQQVLQATRFSRHGQSRRLLGSGTKAAQQESFILHPLKLSNEETRAHWQTWWQSHSCPGLPLDVPSPCSEQ